MAGLLCGSPSALTVCIFKFRDCLSHEGDWKALDRHIAEKRFEHKRAWELINPSDFSMIANVVSTENVVENFILKQTLESDPAQGLLV
jgi:hypothetical protein